MESTAWSEELFFFLGYCKNEINLRQLKDRIELTHTDSSGGEVCEVFFKRLV